MFRPKNPEFHTHMPKTRHRKIWSVYAKSSEEVLPLISTICDILFGICPIYKTTQNHDRALKRPDALHYPYFMALTAPKQEDVLHGNLTRQNSPKIVPKNGPKRPKTAQIVPFTLYLAQRALHEIAPYRSDALKQAKIEACGTLE